MNRRLACVAIAAASTVVGMLGLALSAGAAYHQNFIRQIHPSTGVFGGEWVELQMYADGENQVAGR